MNQERSPTRALGYRTAHRASPALATGAPAVAVEARGSSMRIAIVGSSWASFILLSRIVLRRIIGR